MSLITNEYTVLISQDDSSDVVIKPGVPFEPFDGSFIVSSTALIRDVDTKEIVVILQPGQKVTAVGEPAKVIRLQDQSVKELKEMAVAQGVAFPSKVTKDRLIEILEGE